MKKKIVMWFIIITVYALSSLYCKHWISIAYSDDGRWGNVEPKIGDVAIIFTPAFIASILTLSKVFKLIDSSIKLDFN